MLYHNRTADFIGFEFATFRLREGVSEKDLIVLSKEVDDAFLSKQEGLLSHFLLRGKNGIYADVSLALTQERAEQICQLWLDNEVTRMYLQLLDSESVDMTFWSKIA
ncbi:hypothetical protein MJO52_12160 [Microbulbifer variabilis]|uniref:DUF4286 family protein n=1 Tax=Microbulbifer variabilis TaxID=266805 RepID=A0ABY4V7C9_9GAMM|nr:hypothetical protein [Microbulbifer variabilis]USD19835.1 hypothetical protein MJO52_12160 [Microbulbifer variabilis]